MNDNVNDDEISPSEASFIRTVKEASTETLIVMLPQKEDLISIAQGTEVQKIFKKALEYMNAEIEARLT
jgi:hypothetical protein